VHNPCVTLAFRFVLYDLSLSVIFAFDEAGWSNLQPGNSHLLLQTIIKSRQLLTEAQTVWEVLMASKWLTNVALGTNQTTRNIQSR
jgi:hypothetical protein